MKNDEVVGGELDRLMLLMARLRDPKHGCPWDLQQDLQSLLPYTLEEVYELVDAIERNDLEHFKEELGDYLFQAAFYAEIANENGWFSLREVVDGLVDKLVLRHPHVFPDGKLDGMRVRVQDMQHERIKKNWEQFKDQSRKDRDQGGVLDDVPRALPALQRAQKLQKRAARVGFDWHDANGPRDKLNEELAEYDAALAGGGKDRIEHELGDILFTCVNLARHHGIDADQALSRANRRFETRFAYIEAQAGEANRPVEEYSADELEALWQQAKQASVCP